MTPSPRPPARVAPADEGTTRYETRWVLAGAYPLLGHEAARLTHTLDHQTGLPLCRRVHSDSLADAGANDPGEGEAPPTCKTCLRRDPRFKETFNV